MYDNPAQVLYWDANLGEYIFGIAYHDEIICSCCGSVVPIKEITEEAVGDNEIPLLSFGDNWLDIDELVKKYC